MTRMAPVHTGEVLKQDFWASPTLRELAKAQKVGPLDTAALRGTWPGEDDDGFEDAIDKSRHVGLKETSDSAGGDGAARGATKRRRATRRIG